MTDAPDYSETRRLRREFEDFAVAVPAPGMTDYQHADDWEGTCMAPVGTVDGSDYSCGCVFARPDPESPCGVCSYPKSWPEHAKPNLPFIATACLDCRHPIRVVHDHRWVGVVPHCSRCGEVA